MKKILNAIVISCSTAVFLSGCLTTGENNPTQQQQSAMSAASFEKTTGFIYPQQSQDPYLTNLRCMPNRFESSSPEVEKNNSGILCESEVKNNLKSYIG